MKTKHLELLGRTNVVAVVRTLEDFVMLQMVAHLIDIIEIRLDYWLFPLNSPETQTIIALKKPLIITARDVSEGGGRKDWTIEDRKRLYREYLPYATFIDIEGATADSLSDVIKEAHQAGVLVIISYHNFKGTPPYSVIINQAEICHSLGGDVLKFAVKASNRDDLAVLDDAIMTITGGLIVKCDFKISVMSTDERLGKAYRYLVACLGEIFVYGYLSGASVPGQPKAADIKKVLSYLQ